MWSLMGRRRGLTALGSLGGSRRLAGGTWTGTLLFGGTLLGDVAAAAGGGACVLRAGGSGPRLQLFDQRDVLGGVLVAEAGWRQASSSGVGAHRTGGEPM